MATLVNRQMFWALNHKVVPCVIVAQDLQNAKVTVLLENGARHEVDAYDVRATEEEARVRMAEVRRQYEGFNNLAQRYEGVL